MRVAALCGALLVGLGAMLLPSSEARSGPLPGLHSAASGSLDGLIVKVGKDKAQKSLNKSCGSGKVFVEGKGCINREKAEKKKEKEKEKADTAPPPPPPPKKPCGTLFSVNCQTE